MAIQVQCACGRSVTVPDAYAGKSGKCPACGGTLEFPAQVAATESGTPDLTLRTVSSWEATAGAGENGPAERLAVCAKCNQPAQGEGHFCGICGAPVVLGIVGAAGKLCFVCRKLVPAAALVCVHCNARLADAMGRAAGAGHMPRAMNSDAAHPGITLAPPGLAVASKLKWVLVGLLVVALAGGGWGLIRFFQRMNFDGYVRDGDNCLANGYFGEAETAYLRAKELFPSDPILPKKFEEVAAYKKWKQEMSLKGQPVGSAGHELINRMSEAERRQREVERRFVAPALPMPEAAPRLSAKTTPGVNPEPEK